MNDFYPDFYLVFERVRDEDIVLYPEPAGDYGDVKHLAKDDGVIEVACHALVHPAVFLPRVVDLQVSPPQHVVLEPPMGVLIDLLEKSLHLLARPTLQLHYIIFQFHTAPISFHIIPLLISLPT